MTVEKSVVAQMKPIQMVLKEKNGAMSTKQVRIGVFAHKTTELIMTMLDKQSSLLSKKTLV
jgi:hypothetical protein